MWRGVYTIAINRQGSAAAIERARRALGDDGLMKLHPSNMMAGPCAACLSIADRLHKVTEAMPLPLAGCSHPDQCGCLWQPVIPGFEE